MEAGPHWLSQRPSRTAHRREGHPACAVQAAASSEVLRRRTKAVLAKPPRDQHQPGCHLAPPLPGDAASRMISAARVEDPGSARSSSRPTSCSGAWPSSAREITRDYAGRDLVMMGVLKGAVFFLADLMRQLDRPLRARLHGRLELRLPDRLLGRRPDPQGPRRPDRGQGRPDRRGHRRLRPHAPLPAAQPAAPATRPRSRSARCS